MHRSVNVYVDERDPLHRIIIYNKYIIISGIIMMTFSGNGRLLFWLNYIG